MKLNLGILEEAGVAVREFRAVGGGARSDFWLQLKADIYNRPVHGLEVAEAASFGMALIAGEACGVYDSAVEAAERLITVRETFEPTPEHVEFYERMFSRYQRLYPALKSWHENTDFPGNQNVE
jgi:xylulokinase